jgi:ferrous iron transport protein A
MTQNSTKTLAQMRKGERATVFGITAGSKQLRHRLLSLGIVRGNEILITEVAPFGDPINIQVLDSKIAIRLCEAAHVIVLPKIWP